MADSVGICATYGHMAARLISVFDRSRPGASVYSFWGNGAVPSRMTPSDMTPTRIRASVLPDGGQRDDLRQGAPFGMLGVSSAPTLMSAFVSCPTPHLHLSGFLSATWRPRQMLPCRMLSHLLKMLLKPWSKASSHQPWQTSALPRPLNSLCVGRRGSGPWRA